MHKKIVDGTPGMKEKTTLPPIDSFNSRSATAEIHDAQLFLYLLNSKHTHVSNQMADVFIEALKCVRRTLMPSPSAFRKMRSFVMYCKTLNMLDINFPF